MSPASSPMLSRIERISMSFRVRSIKSSFESSDGPSASTTTGKAAAAAVAIAAAGAGSRCGFLPLLRDELPSGSPSGSVSSFPSKASRKRSLKRASRCSRPTAVSAKRVDAVSLTASYVSEPCCVTELKVEAMVEEAAS